jgi:hypothetical protein
MKIITKGGVYVQKKDIYFLKQSNLIIPSSIFMKILRKKITLIDDIEKSKNDFVKFTNLEEIEFFSGIDWMIDYYEFKDLLEDEIIELEQVILGEMEEIAGKFNAMTENKKKDNINMFFQFRLLDFKINSLREILDFKKGSIFIRLPSKVEYLISYDNKYANVFFRKMRILKKV